jgi:hypothetical protein
MGSFSLLTDDELQQRLDAPWQWFTFVGCTKRPFWWWLPWPTHANNKFKNLVYELKSKIRQEQNSRNKMITEREA